MFTVFFNGTGEYKIAILPEGQKANSAYFIESVLRPLAEFYYPQGREQVKGESRCILTMRRFTKLRGAERIWRVLDSEERRIRLIVQI
jgi:hypothetical protein